MTSLNLFHIPPSCNCIRFFIIDFLKKVANAKTIQNLLFLLAFKNIIIVFYY